MTSLEFEYDLAMVRRFTPDFIPCRAERRKHFFTGYWAYLSLQFPLSHVLLPRNKQYTGEHRHAAADAQGAARPTPAACVHHRGLEGEPLRHPHFFDALDVMSSRTDSLCIVSNGSLIDRQIATRLAAYPVGTFVLSIDAGDETTYRLIRKGGELRSFKKKWGGTRGTTRGLTLAACRSVCGKSGFSCNPAGCGQCRRGVRAHSTRAFAQFCGENALILSCKRAPSRLTSG